jgi:hypothetical protein
MCEQLTIFDVLRSPIIKKSEKEDGEVINRMDYILPNPKSALHIATLSVGQHSKNKLWLWCVTYCYEQSGGGYGLHPTTRIFAETEADALYYAAKELHDGIIKYEKLSTLQREALAWVKNFL